MSHSSASSTDFGRVGVWSGRLQCRPTQEAVESVTEWSELGYGMTWVSESPGGKDVLTFSAVLLGSSPKARVATGIASVWARDAVSMANASRTLSDAYPDRFALGIGVSHRNTTVLRGHRYAAPLHTMRSYLEEMNAAPFDGHPPANEAPRLVAALGPKMTALAGELADGVHPFLSSPEHTSKTKTILGPTKVVAVEQGVILSSDPGNAREMARANLERFLKWPNYRRHLIRQGFREDELTQGGSDRLVDSLYAWGDEKAIRSRVQEHLDAGADHVCVQVVSADNEEREVLRVLAPTLVQG